MTVDPAAGDPVSIRRLARRHTDVSDALRSGTATLESAVVECRTAWRGAAQRAWECRASEVPAEVRRVRGRVDAAAEVLARYAIDVERIKDEAARIRALRAIAAPLTPEDDASALLDRRWDALVAERQRVDRRAAAALADTGVLGSVADRDLGAMTDTALLTLLAGLRPEEIAALALDPALGERLAAVRDPRLVAEWWRSLDRSDGDGESAVQLALVAALPGVIGNLEGVAYRARDAANRIVLARELDRGRREIRRLERVLAGARDSGAIATTRALLDGMRAWIAGYAAVSRALERATPSQPLQLVSLVPDAPPLAQIAVGDLDRAAIVSYVVPGMNSATDVPGSVDTYVGAARRLREEQFRVGHIDPADVATVAWLGYHPPMQDLSAADVIGSGRAAVGGAALAVTLDGFHAARGATGEPASLSVVAHSYGTTVAAVALQAAPADHVVLLGSAGVTVPSADRLRVPEGQVFASQGHEDAWAVIGQRLSHRQDPTAPGFGAEVLTAEGSVADGEALEGITMHGPVAGSPGEYSYLDRFTTALHSTALATLGRGDEAPRGGTPIDRAVRDAVDGDWDLFALQFRPSFPVIP